MKLLGHAVGSLLAFAVVVWIALGLFVGALDAPPRLVAEAFASRDAPFRGLPDCAAVAVLRERFGEGVSAADGRKLYDLIFARRYRRALDIGTARGYAALWLGLVMRSTGGRVTTIEIDPALAAQACQNILRAGLADVIESRVADALVDVPTLPGYFDFVFLDLGGAHHAKLLDLLAPRLVADGAVLSHNGYFLRFTAPEYLSALRARPDLDLRILPTLSGGIAVSTRRSLLPQ